MPHPICFDHINITLYNAIMAKDAIHDAVKNALIKDGWTILREQVHLSFGELEGYVDIAAQRLPIMAVRDNHQLLVEVKSFSGRSFMRQLQQAIGQYTLYRDMIELSGLTHHLVLAISDFVYDTYFARPATTLIMHRHRISLLVVQIESEEIFKWIE